jgi:hypothetical protein
VVHEEVCVVQQCMMTLSDHLARHRKIVLAIPGLMVVVFAAFGGGLSDRLTSGLSDWDRRTLLSAR